MRRTSSLFAVAACAALLSAGAAHAQITAGGGQAGGSRTRGEIGSNLPQAPVKTPQVKLPGTESAGPCPYVKVLYDAGRYQEFRDGRESASAVQFTGEIEGVEAACLYKGEEPIKVKLAVLFALGKGPQAQGDTKNYRYWVAVTRRNSVVIAKEYFDLPVKFPDGRDRVSVGEQLEEIVIPRANTGISGSNFEILVGFDVTPEMAAFNREGKRFRIDAGSQGAATSGQ